MLGITGQNSSGDTNEWNWRVYIDRNYYSDIIELKYLLPQSIIMSDWDTLRSKLEKYEQAHLLQYINELSAEQADELYRDLNSIDYEKVNEYFRKCQISNKVVEKKDEYLQPLDSDSIGSTARDREKLGDWEKLGFEQISEGKVML